MTMSKLWLSLVLVGLATGVAHADPNDLSNGVLITHYPPGLAYTVDPTDWCARYASFQITSFAEQNPTITVSTGVVWYVLAAWNETDKTWCGTEFGLGTYDSNSFAFTASGQCPASALVIPTAAWPGPNQGVAIAATTEPWVGNFRPVYYFGGYAYYQDLMQLTTNPGTGFGGFANCQTPAVPYTASCFGAMGLLRAGVSCTPSSAQPAVCCVGETCSLLLEAECTAAGGVFHGDLTSCGPPNPCALPHVCCVGEVCHLVLETECATLGGVFHSNLNSCGPPNPCALPHVCCVGEVCSIVLQTECAAAGGVFYPNLDSCTPNPCVLPHVCCVGETCSLLLESECAAAGGVFHPEFNSCTPNPCALPHVCCVGEVCHLVLETECATLGGVFHSNLNSCGPPNPCALPHVCCVGEFCSLVLETECAGVGGVFHPEWSSCGPPNPCAVPHVCCVGDACQLTLQAECDGLGGIFHPEWSSCAPNPCSGPFVCCVGETCQLVNALDCANLGGVFHPEWTSCLPNPCSQPITVCPDGSGQYLTIQAAVDAAADGQEIQLCDGVFQGPGNRDVTINGKSLYIRSMSGDPAACVILCGGTPGEPHRAFDVAPPAGGLFLLGGVTVEGGWVAGEGGAVLCIGGAPILENCWIVGNQAAHGGALAYFNTPGKNGDANHDAVETNTHRAPRPILRRDPTPNFTNCVITGNLAIGNGGGLLLEGAPATGVTGCTFSGNWAGIMGGGIYANLIAAELTVGSTILWGDCAADVGNEVFILPVGSGAAFTNCDVATDGVAGPGSVTWGHGVIHVDPLFCAAQACDSAPTTAGDYHLTQDSPCATHIDVFDLRKGALPVGCDARSSDPEHFSATGGLWLAPSSPGLTGGVHIRYAIPSALAGQPVALRIFDSSGRLVRTLDAVNRSAGVHETVWDGIDLNGQPAGWGVYFCRLDAGSSRLTRRLVVVR
jgi:hypothetical protein